MGASLTRTSILVFGTNRDEIHSWASRVRQRCKDWGVNLAGPIAPPGVTVYRRTGELKSKSTNADAAYGTWFDELDLTADEIDAIYPPDGSNDRERIFARIVRLEDERAVRKLFDEEWHPDLLFRVEITDGGHSATPHPDESHLAAVEESEVGDSPDVIQQLMGEFGLI